MKHSKHNETAGGHAAQLIPVRFEFEHPTAKSVCIAGTFNHWHPAAKPLHSGGAGHWWKETGLAAGRYEYCLVVDGEWMPDPHATESVPNPYGGRNSVLNVTQPGPAAVGAGVTATSTT